MLFDMEHPAIVSRRKRSVGEPEFALVRTTSPIEVPDYAVDDVQTAVILHHSAGTTTYRKIGDHLFKQMGHMSASALRSGSEMMDSLMGRDTVFDIGSFMRHVQTSVFQLGSDDMHMNVAYFDRRLTKSEMRQSSSSALLKTFRMAPTMKSQPWLGSDAETLRQFWSVKFAEFMQNIAIVDGIVHVRSFEPCLKMRVSRNSRDLSYGKLAYMEPYPGEPRLASRPGIPFLGDDDIPGERYFSLNEKDLAAEIARELGCTNELALSNQATHAATVVDPGALSPDFLDEETYRVAVHALQVSDGVSNDLAGLSYDVRKEGDLPDFRLEDNRNRLVARLEEIALPEKALIDLVAPTAELEPVAISQATDKLVAVLRREGEFLSRATAGALSELEASLAFLETRRDAMPISLDRIASRGPGYSA